MSNFWKNSKFAQRVLCEYINKKPQKNSKLTPWVIPPLPPVSTTSRSIKLSPSLPLSSLAFGDSMSFFGSAFFFFFCAVPFFFAEWAIGIQTGGFVTISTTGTCVFLHSGHWGIFPFGKCWEYVLIRSNIPRIFQPGKLLDYLLCILNFQRVFLW